MLDYATDHFMICGGICSEMRSNLRILGVSNKMFQLLNLFSFVIGRSSLIRAPSGDVVCENGYLCDGAGWYKYAAEDGENFIGRLRYRLRMMTCSLGQTSTDTKI